MSSYTLIKLLDEIIDWCSVTEFPYGIPISRTILQLDTVRNYISELQVDSGFTSRMYRKLRFNEVWDARFEAGNHQRFAEMVECFMQDLGELFKVPKQEQLLHTDNTLKQNELVAGFIGFLLQLLHPGSDSLVRVLRFLVTILGDAPFQSTENEQVQSLLAEFEEVANEAGSIVHFIIFVSDPRLKRVDEAIGALLEHIHLLEANIIKCFNSLPNNIVVSPVDSLFIVDSLLRDLEDLMNRGDDLLLEVKDLIKRLHQRLMLSQFLLKSMRVPEHSEIEELKEPVMQVRGLAYQAEHLINLFLAEDAPRWYVTIRLTHLINDFELIETRLQEIKKVYDAGALNVAEDFSVRLSLQAKKDYRVDDIIVGFEDVERKILDQLEGGKRQLQIIFVSGMAGIGKTTLAKKLYNHPLVHYHFDKRCWCVVSQIYQKKNTLIDILVNLQSDFDEEMILNMDEPSLAERIYKDLKGRRYLIIIDDLWDSNVWADMRMFFPDDGNGSRILFTSRNKNLAPSGGIIHELPLLSNDQCWELLKRKVFQSEPCPPKLQSIGKEIATNCHGLPLAVAVIAGFLSAVDKEGSTWNNVLRSLHSYMFSDQSDSVEQILELSYRHLPQHLKPCFLYLGVFREDSQIFTKRLKCMWIAEGFIYDQKETRRALSVAEEYLTELIERSLVIVVKKRSDGGAKVCVIHDLLRDLCLRVAKKENFLKLMDHDCSIWNQKFRRLGVHGSPLYQSSSRELVPCGLFIRSFYGYLRNSSLSVLNMKLLRVLHCQPEFACHDLVGIELLVHLRYLAVDRMVPSIDCLVNLEFLIVRDKVYILNLVKMVRLRFLSAFAVDFGGSTSQTNNLEYLSVFKIGCKEDVEVLKYSPHLRRLKCFVCTPECGDLSFLTQLESLRAELSCRISWISPPSSITKLTLLGGYLSGERMSTIGALPNLEVLKLRSSSFDGERWDTSDGEFKQLRFLELEDVELAQWNVSSSQHFPMLQQLVLTDCEKLMEIPGEIGEIAPLQLIELRGFSPESLVESALRIRQQEEDLGNGELLRVIINGLNSRCKTQVMFDKHLRRQSIQAWLRRWTVRARPGAYLENGMERRRFRLREDVM